MSTYQPIIGLEIHVELATNSKMFCGCDAHWQQYKPNQNTCPVCLGMPGALPVPNRTAVEYTIKIAQALGCRINQHSHFDRKHYFYPDLPKGYQISQYDEPIGVNGEVPVLVKDEKTNAFAAKSFRIHRVHLEEDTGKLSHIGADTVVDFNRSSVPLVEIVTEADFRSSDEVKTFLQELHTIITYLHVSDADMEKGSMRLEPNISVKVLADGEVLPARITDPKLFPPYKVEVKNINSFNFVKKAVDYEVKRHIELLGKGEIPAQETRGWDETHQKTVAQRSKENAHDYRYFPEPDIPPMVFEDALLTKIKATLPELPYLKVERYVSRLGLKTQDALTLTREAGIAAKFEEIITQAQKSKASIEPQTVANLIVNKKLSLELTPTEFVLKAAELSKPKETDTKLLAATVQKVLATNEKSVTDYRAGKTNAVMFLVGQVMREMRGQADAATVKSALEKALA